MSYQVHDLSDKKVKFGYWFLVNKSKFKSFLILLLGVWCVATVGYGIYGFALHYLEIGNIDQLIKSMITRGVDFESYHQRNSPAELEVNNPSVIYAGNDLYDLYAKVYNPNENYAVLDLNFRFTSGSFISETRRISLYPKQEALLLSLANLSQKRLSTAKLEIISMNWSKIKTGDMDSRLEFEISKPEINQFDLGRNWAAFTATNNHSYNYRQVIWQALLYSGQKVVGVNQLISENFESSETRSMEISWFEKLPRISRVEIIPMVDFNLPDAIYRTPGLPGSDLNF